MIGLSTMNLMNRIGLRSWMHMARMAAIAITLVFAGAAYSQAPAQADELQDVNQMLRNGQLDQALARVNSCFLSPFHFRFFKFYQYVPKYVFLSNTL